VTSSKGVNVDDLGAEQYRIVTFINMVQWAGEMSPEEIAEVRLRDDRDRIRHYGRSRCRRTCAPAAAKSAARARPKGFWRRLRSLFR
jgi:hypothetical protein